MTSRKAPNSTTAVHAGEPRTHPYDALTAPIVQTSTYSFRTTSELVEYMEGRKQREEYGRYGNPSVRLIEEKFAQLQGGEDGSAFSSGMAAVTTSILALTKAGAHVVLFNDCYRRTRQFLVQVLARFGVECTLVPAGDLDALTAALRPETRLVISELPTNPYQNVVDLKALCEICSEAGVKTLVDSTFATPINLQALSFGADVVIESATKYLAGHNDVLCGLIAGNRGIVSLIRDLRHVLGGVCDPHAAYLVQRGMKGLALRVAQQNQTAMKLASELESHPEVERVWYPGLSSHPDHAEAKRLMSGFGGVVTFEVKGDLERTSRFIDACRIPRIAPSLGGVESLIEQPSLMSYFELSTEERLAVGIKDNLVRYAVGIEDTEDIVVDAIDALDRS